MNKFTLGLMALLFILIFMTAMVLNDVKSETIPVKADETSGVVIEEAAGTVDGVIQAEWNDETKELEVVFDGTKTDLSSIESAIEKSGFETSDSSKTEALETNVLEETDSGNKNDPKPALRRNAASKAEGF
jgi:periplasmic mercuric ion binding protein